MNHHFVALMIMIMPITSISQTVEITRVERTLGANTGWSGPFWQEGCDGTSWFRSYDGNALTDETSLYSIPISGDHWICSDAGTTPSYAGASGDWSEVDPSGFSFAQQSGGSSSVDYYSSVGSARTLVTFTVNDPVEINILYSASFLRLGSQITVSNGFYLNQCTGGSNSNYACGSFFDTPIDTGIDPEIPDEQSFSGTLNPGRYAFFLSSSASSRLLPGNTWAGASNSHTMNISFDPLAKIDVQPSDPNNFVDTEIVGSSLALAILGDEDFDATSVDATTLRFGPDQASVLETPGVVGDTNGDGFSDLIVDFSVASAGINCEFDSYATLSGETFIGDEFQASDFVSTPDCPACHP